MHLTTRLLATFLFPVGILSAPIPLEVRVSPHNVIKAHPILTSPRTLWEISQILRAVLRLFIIQTLPSFQTSFLLWLFLALCLSLWLFVKKLPTMQEDRF
jgi:hypothetical protein